MVYYLAYMSSSRAEWSEQQVRDLVASSQRHNEALGVTGVLLYKGGSFLHVLEGEREVVRALFDRVGRDPRHHRILVLLQGEQPEREFGDWSMAFSDLDTADSCCGEYADFLSSPATHPLPGPTAAACRKLLYSFRSSLERA